MDATRWLELGKEKFDNQEYFKARDLLDNAIQFDPDFVEARRLRALTYIHLGELELALEELDYLVEQGAADTHLHLQRAGLLLVLDRPEKAREEFERVLKEEPENLDGLKGIGDSYFKQGNFLDAHATYDRILKRTPDDPYVWFSKAETYYRSQAHEEAFEAIERAIELKAAPEFFAFKGDFYIRHDNFERALEQYVLARNLDPKNPEILLRLGFIYRVLDRAKDALAAFEDALKENPYLVEALENKVQVLHSLGREEQAVFTMEQLVRLEPRDERRSLELAQYYLDDQDYDRADEFFEQTIKYHPENAEAWYGWSYSLYQLGRYEQALDAIEKAQELDPGATEELGQLKRNIEAQLE